MLQIKPFTNNLLCIWFPLLETYFLFHNKSYLICLLVVTKYKSQRYTNIQPMLFIYIRGFSLGYSFLI